MIQEIMLRQLHVVTKSRSAKLREGASSLRKACRNHPFVTGIADGSLPTEIFSRWVIQDWRYLLTYIEILEGLASLAPKQESAIYWLDLAVFTRTKELALHRAYAKRFDITKKELDEATDAPATIAYTQFLRQQVQHSYGMGVASLLPCGVGYVTLAADLAKGPMPQDVRYVDWIHTYADPSFAEAVAWMEAELDTVEGDEGELFSTYQQGAEHELAFWDQLWKGW